MGKKQVVDQMTGDVSYVDDGTDTPTFSPMLTPGEFVASDPLQWQADWRKHQEQVANNQADAANGGGSQTGTYSPGAGFTAPKTTMPGLPTGPVMPGTQPKNVMPGQPNNPYDDTPISPWDRFTNWVDYTNNFAKNNKYWTGNPNPSSQSPSQWWTANAPSETAKPSWWNGTPNSEMPVINPALKTQSRESGLPTSPSETNPTNGFAPGSSPSPAGNMNPIAWQEQQAAQQSGLRPGLYGGLTIQQVKDFEKAQGRPVTEKDLNDLLAASEKGKANTFGQPNGTTYGGANNNYFRDIVLGNPSASDSDAAYQAAVKGGFKGTMNDWLITKDAILHNANRGNGGFSGYSGSNGSNAATTTPITTETSGFSPSTWTPRPWQSDKGILKFDEQDWSTIPNEVRPFVDSLLRAKGWSPTGQYGLYGAIEYKYGGNAPSNIWFDNATFEGLPDNVKQYLQNLFAQKGWTTTPTETTTTTTA